MTMLDACTKRINSLSDADKQSMFELYRNNYDEAMPDIFARDLAAKDYTILLTDAQKNIRGFSTMAICAETFRGKPVRTIYSGDTIIDKEYWGKNDFAAAWLRLVGHIKAQSPQTALYWLLIVKGHRTYRYLPLFSKEYYPRYDVATPDAQQELMDHLARARFGEAYDPESGLVKFSGHRSFLREDLAPIPAKDMSRNEIKYFLSRNPGYTHGDELLCLCELEPDNLTRFSRTWFLEGMAMKEAA